MLYNIDYGVAGVLFLVVYYFFLKTQYSTNLESNRKFRLQIVFLLLADLLDVITAITISYAAVIPLWINVVLNNLLFVLAGFTGYMMPIYINFLLNPTNKRTKIFYVNISILVAYLFLCVINPFTGVICYFDADRKYTGGPFYFLVFILPYIYMTETIIRVIILRKNLKRKQFISIIVFSIVASIGGIIQVLFLSNVLLSYFFIAVAAVVLLFSFETPDYQRLVKTTEELQLSKHDLERARIKEEETTRIIQKLMKSSNWKLEYYKSNNEIISQYWSPEFKAMLGKEDCKEEEATYLWLDALHPDDKERASNAFYQGMIQAEPFDENYRLLDKTGEYRWYRGTGEISYDAETDIVTYQGIIQDIHDEKTLEIMSKERESALNELQRSQDALKKALDQAQEASMAKSRFLSNMSHDIRTPMNAIVGFTDLASENLDDKGKVEECLEKIQVSGNHLLMLINDVLDMSRIESGKVTIDPTPANISEIMYTLEKIFEGQLKNKKLGFTLDMDGVKNPNVICDKLRLNQILLNCVGNSVKFTPEGGSIAIQVQQMDSAESDMAEYSIIIADTGIGMSQEFLAHIFEPFERERTSTISKTQGTGLGMSITKSLVELMGGIINIESREGEGTTYTITLPLKFSGESDTNGDGRDKSDGVSVEEMLEFLKGKHFLLVDDNATNRLLAKGVLGAKGMTCEEADDGTTAVERMARAVPGEFDMILMDVQMPVMNGYEATDAIRAMDDPRISNIPILAMTANAFEEDKQECLAHGMNGHLSKPFKADELVRKLYISLV